MGAGFDRNEWNLWRNEYGNNILQPRIYFKRNPNYELRFYNHPRTHNAHQAVAGNDPLNVAGTKSRALFDLMEALPNNVTLAQIRMKRGIYAMHVNFPNNVVDGGNVVVIPAGEYYYVGKAERTGFFSRNNANDNNGRCHTGGGRGHFDGLPGVVRHCCDGNFYGANKETSIISM